MNDNKEFDKYIKGLFDEDPKVPSELKWEKMDFDLPTTNEQSNKPNRKKYIGLLLLLFIAIAIAYFNVKKEEVIDYQPLTQSTQQPSDDKIRSKSNTYTSQPKKQDTKEANDLKEKQVSDNSITQSHTQTVIQKIENTPAPNNIPKQISPSNTALAQTAKVSLATQINNQSISINSKNDFLKDFSENNTIPVNTISKNVKPKSSISTPSFSPPLKTESTQKSEQQITETLPIIQINNLPISNKSTLLPSPDLLQTDYVDNKSKFHFNEVYIGYGLNNFNLKTDSTSTILKDKINKAIGNSLRAGVRLRLNDNWAGNFQLKYDRFHSTFEHIRSLDTLYDGQRLIRIYRYEETFHNNYTSTLGLQLGLERRWQVANRLQLYAGLGIAPTYALSATGKTTAKTDVERLAFDNQVGRFSINGGISAGVIVPINQSINVEAAYQYNRFLFNNIFINNGIQSNQQNAVSLMITYRLTK